MSLALGLALLCGLALLGLLAIVFRRGTRRVREELRAAISEHNAALGGLVDGVRTRWADEPGATWRQIVRDTPQATLRLGVAPVLRRSTFILHVTRLGVTALAGRCFAWPAADGAAQPLQIALVGAQQVPPALRALGLGAALEQELLQLTVGLRLERELLQLTARPAAPVIRRYSYGIELQRSPAALERLLAAGAALAAALAVERPR